MVEQIRKRRSRNPEATREVILEAARTILAEEGIEGLSVSAVAHAACVNRGTAYMHFETRENLITQTIASVSEILLYSVYGENAEIPDVNVAEIDLVTLTESLTNFAMSNPDLCRVWLLQVLASPNPSADPFWRKYMTNLQKFSETDLAQPEIDAEVLSVLVLAGTFLWPIWAHAGSLDPAGRKRAANRFSRELMRLSLHGSMIAERFPTIPERIASGKA